MGRSQESFNKKEVRKNKEKKRKDKAKKRQERKEEGTDSFDDMIAYVDEYGNLLSTPPDPDEKDEIAAEDIEVSATKNKPVEETDPIRKGIVTFFNDNKGFGFIRDIETKQSIFVHANNLLEPITDNNKVIFEIEKGPKGLIAVNVKVDRE